MKIGKFFIASLFAIIAATFASAEEQAVAFTSLDAITEVGFETTAWYQHMSHISNELTEDFEVQTCLSK